MKLTTEMLKKLILEELNEEPTQPTPDQSAEPQGSPEKADGKNLNSLSKLGDEFIETGKALKSGKVKGLDTAEMNLVSELMAINLKLASGKSAGTILKRVLTLIQKQM